MLDAQLSQNHTIFSHNHGNMAAIRADYHAKYRGVLVSYELSVDDLMLLDNLYDYPRCH